MVGTHLLDQQASRTAMSATFLRALSALDSRSELRGNDNLAEIFLSGKHKLSLDNTNVVETVLSGLVAPGMYELVIARTAFFDDIFEKALNKNVGQIVIWGAGYDSRPYRFEKQVKNTIIFKLDTQPIQLNKLGLLKQNQVRIPEQLRFVPVNSVTDNFKKKLISAGFDKNMETVFL